MNEIPMKEILTIERNSDPCGQKSIQKYQIILADGVSEMGSSPGDAHSAQVWA